MATIDLTADTFENAIADNPIVLVDWWASWSGPCRMFAPVFQAASLAHSDVMFAKVDTEKQRALARSAQITSIPTLMAFRDGILVFSRPGAQNAAGLEQIVAAVQKLDMDDVRAQVAAHRTTV